MIKDIKDHTDLMNYEELPKLRVLDMTSETQDFLATLSRIEDKLDNILKNTYPQEQVL